jgi:6-phospho-beta-glucosidase
MALKIAILGGGSAYAPGLINAFINKGNIFKGAQFTLMDIADKELQIVTSLAQKMASITNSDIKINATTDQKEAIEGADYVISTFRQGGFKARHLDESVPLLYNVIGQETIGPGGFFFAMRTLPVIKSILADIKAFAPSATLINYTNPTQIVAEAVSHFSSIPCISICDQTKSDQQKILYALDMRDANVFLESIGFNHATWSTVFKINGEEGVEVMNRNARKVLARPDIDNRVKRQFRLTQEFGRVPNSYLQYYYFREETLAEAKAAKKTRAEEIIEALPSYYQHFEEQASVQYPKLTHVRGGSVFGDMAVEVVKSLVKNDDSIHILNVTNHSALPDFSPDRIVEVPARLNLGRATPLVQPHLPSELLGLLHMLGEYQWLAAEAIWEGDRKALEHALASNPLILSLNLAHKLLDHMLPLIMPYLPN